MKRKIIPLMLFLLGFLIFTYPYIAHYINDYAMQQKIDEFELVSAQPIPTEEQEEIWNEMAEYNEALLNNPQGVQDVFTDEVIASNPFYSNAIDEENNLNESIATANSSDSTATDSPAATENTQSNPSLSSSTFYSIIRIPKINVELPLYLGATDANLMKGAAHVSGTSLPVGGKNTHALIAGHRGTLRHNMFLEVNKLVAGDTFEIQTLDKIMTYRVTGTKVVLPNDVDSLTIKKDKDLVTLVTCLKYPMNYKRLLVYGERVN